MTFNGYQRLPGGLRGFVRRTSTWAGEDHLLLISGTRYHERYQRVFYSDILAVIVQRGNRFTASWLWFTVVFGLFVSALILRALPYTGPLLFSLCGAVVVLQIGLSMAAGCRMVIATAVGNVPLPGVARRWDASRFMKKLGPRIAETQQVVAPPIKELPQ